MVNQKLKATDNGSIHGHFLSLSGFVLLFKPLVSQMNTNIVYSVDVHVLDTSAAFQRFNSLLEQQVLYTGENIDLKEASFFLSFFLSFFKKKSPSLMFLVWKNVSLISTMCCGIIL